MEALGWVMRNGDDDPVVIAVTDNGVLLIRDCSFAHGRSWMTWEPDDIEHGAAWVMNEYENGGYTLVVEPLQRFIPGSFIGNPQSQYEEDAVEETMGPLLEALTVELGILKLPKLVSAYGLSIGAYTPHTYDDGKWRCAPAVTIAGKIRA